MLDLDVIKARLAIAQRVLDEGGDDLNDALDDGDDEAIRHVLLDPREVVPAIAALIAELERVKALLPSKNEQEAIAMCVRRMPANNPLLAPHKWTALDWLQALTTANTKEPTNGNA